MPFMGSERYVTGTWRDETGNLGDPQTVEFLVMRPDGGKTVYVYGTDAEVARISEGVYRLLVALTQAGTWTVWGRSLGTLIDSGRTQFVVEAAPW